MKKIESFYLGELFCGSGGLALGAALASTDKKNKLLPKIINLWGVDNDPQAIHTYNSNIVSRFGGKGICTDANEFCNEELSNYKLTNALAFGFPCNDFSLVGKKKGIKGSYGNLYKAGVTAIEKINPYWFIAENVSGIHSSDSGNTFREILYDLENSGKFGYNITVHLYKFEYYGVPQYRHRYIIIGMRKDFGLCFKIPAPTHGINGTPFVTAKEALSDISTYSENNELPLVSKKITDRLKLTPPWENAWFLDYLLEIDSDERKEILKKLPWYNADLKNLNDDDIVKMVYRSKLNCKKARMSHIYRRLDPLQPSYTITGSGGGGTHVYHWHYHRSLTNREKAKLQGFPDWFKFEGTKDQVRKQIGMAVPPYGAKIIFEAVLKTFAGIQYNHTKCNFSMENRALFT